jgi:hypothetical protein
MIHRKLLGGTLEEEIRRENSKATKGDHSCEDFVELARSMTKIVAM